MSNRRKKNTQRRRPAQARTQQASRPTATAVLDREDEETTIPEDTEQEDADVVEDAEPAATPRKSIWRRRKNLRASKSDARKGRDLNLSERLHLRFGARGVGTIHFGLNLAVTLAVIFVIYVMIWTTISMLIPSIAAGLLNFSGTSPDTVRFDALMAVWFAPLMFVVVMLAIGEIFLIRKLWSLGARVRKGTGLKLGIVSKDESAAADEKTTPKTGKKSGKKEN